MFLSLFVRKKRFKRFKSEIDVTSLHERIKSCEDVVVCDGKDIVTIKDVLKHGNNSLKYEANLNTNNTFVSMIHKFIHRHANLQNRNNRIYMYSSPNRCRVDYDDTDVYMTILRGSCSILLFDLPKKLDKSMEHITNVVGNYDFISLREGDVLYIRAYTCYKLQNDEPVILIKTL